MLYVVMLQVIQNTSGLHIQASSLSSSFLMSSIDGEFLLLLLMMMMMVIVMVVAVVVVKMLMVKENCVVYIGDTLS